MVVVDPPRMAKQQNQLQKKMVQIRKMNLNQRSEYENSLTMTIIRKNRKKNELM